MNLDKLKKDWAENPQLNHLAFKSVEDLAAHLIKAHKEMMEGKHGLLGYLYREQTLKLKELKK